MSPRSLSLLLVLAIVATPIALSEEADPSTYTEVGSPLPAIDFTTVEGVRITNQSLKGSVVVLNFFATWCGPCRDELPHIETELWQKYREEEFELIVVGREHTPTELNLFRAETGFTFPMAADPTRVTYNKFAEKWIPRTYVIDRDGTILFQSKGFDPQEFSEMVGIIDAALEGDKKTVVKSKDNAKTSKSTASDDSKSVTISGETRIRIQHRDN